MPICKTCSNTPDAEGPSTCPTCGRSSANGRYIAWDSDNDPTWARFGGAPFGADPEMRRSLPWFFTRLAIGGIVLSALAILGAYAASAQSRRVCTDYGTCASRSQEWPYSVYRYRCCKHYSWVDSYRQRYDDEDYGVRRHSSLHCAKDDRGNPAIIEVVGLSAFDDKTAELNAQRQWRVTVTHRFGEVFADLANALRYKWRCLPVSNNESILGKAGELIVGEAAVRKRCGLEALPCRQPMTAGEAPERGERSDRR